MVLWVWQVLLDYYSRLTTRDANGIAVRFGAQAKIGGGQIANYSGQAQQVALFSSRGPDIKDFNFNQADILKPNVLAPGYLIWGAWTPIGIDNPDYIGELLNCKEKKKNSHSAWWSFEPFSPQYQSSLSHKGKKKKKLLASSLFSTHCGHKSFRHTDLRPKDFWGFQDRDGQWYQGPVWQHPMWLVLQLCWKKSILFGAQQRLHQQW